MFYIPTIKLASRAGVLLLSEVAPPYLIHPSNAFLGLDILIYSEIQKTEMFSINKKKIRNFLGNKNQYIDHRLPRNFQLLLFYSISCILHH
jgi:hypothetical protein